MYGDDATRQRCRQLAGSHLLRRCRRERIVQHQHIAATIDEYMALRAVTNHPRRDRAADEIVTECAIGSHRAGDMACAIRMVELPTAVPRVGTAQRPHFTKLATASAKERVCHNTQIS